MTARGLTRTLATVLRAGALAVTIVRLVRPAGGSVAFDRTDPGGDRGGTVGPQVTVVIPARDEAGRIGPCLDALHWCGDVEVVVVDDQSVDDTAAIARASGARVVAGSPLPPGWAGKAWALQQGIEAATGDVIVTLDADVVPAPALVGFLTDRLAQGFDLLTVAGRFDCPTPGSRWLHPALLTTLVYRFGRPDPDTAAARPALANGQCMAFRRAAFLAVGGMAQVSRELVEDVALARASAKRGWRVGFVPGEDLLTVRMFESFADTWTGWGRSIALPGVEPRGRQVLDLGVLASVQAAPLVRLLLRRADLLDVVAIAVRVGTLVGTARVYERPGVAYWASPLADPLAVVRLAWSVVRPSRSWRGRTYPAAAPR